MQTGTQHVPGIHSKHLFCTEIGPDFLEADDGTVRLPGSSLVALGSA